ncbi:hypothetical protein KIPB_000035 [Kipferlia bialata]|uniref:Uncharacterized protein n=1 Tax=Kipferlia bialata TaxID=797122 RepID=A0A9K3GE70_9EUKA|nr:hypothetical protein KIPB_000035 [Kipferlia bialata]|eukprot:g35.t1
MRDLRVCSVMLCLAVLLCTVLGLSVDGMADIPDYVATPVSGYMHTKWEGEGTPGEGVVQARLKRIVYEDQDIGRVKKDTLYAAGVVVSAFIVDMGRRSGDIVAQKLKENPNALNAVTPDVVKQAIEESPLAETLARVFTDRAATDEPQAEAEGAVPPAAPLPSQVKKEREGKSEVKTEAGAAEAKTERKPAPKRQVLKGGDPTLSALDACQAVDGTASQARVKGEAVMGGRGREGVKEEEILGEGERDVVVKKEPRSVKAQGTKRPAAKTTPVPMGLPLGKAVPPSKGGLPGFMAQTKGVSKGVSRPKAKGGQPPPPSGLPGFIGQGVPKVKVEKKTPTKGKRRRQREREGGSKGPVSKRRPEAEESPSASLSLSAQAGLSVPTPQGLSLSVCPLSDEAARDGQGQGEMYTSPISLGTPLGSKGLLVTPTPLSVSLPASTGTPPLNLRVPSPAPATPSLSISLSLPVHTSEVPEQEGEETPGTATRNPLPTINLGF